MEFQSNNKPAALKSDQQRLAQGGPHLGLYSFYKVLLQPSLWFSVLVVVVLAGNNKEESKAAQNANEHVHTHCAGRQQKRKGVGKVEAEEETVMKKSHMRYASMEMQHG